MSIFEHLEREWHDAGDWFSRHARHDEEPAQPGDTIAAGRNDTPAQGAAMSLNSIAADVRAIAQHGADDLRTLLDQHLPQIEALGQLVDGNPVFASAQNAAHVPLELLQGVAQLLDTMAAAHPKPEAPAEAAPEPQPVG